MSNIVDKVFTEVCLDERITDGIFKMEEEHHMDALRDYFIKRGIPKKSAISVTNRMVEGKYPERQAYRKEDGILVTWPSPQHMQKAMQKAPGKYTNQNPNPKKEEPEKEDPKIPTKNDTLPKSDDFEKSDDLEKKTPTIFQGNKQLEVEPSQDSNKSSIPTAPVSPVAPPQPRTPERIAAEKEVVKQIINTDDSTLSNIAAPVYTETLRKHQLQELYKKADEWGFEEAVKFLTPYVNS